MGQGEAVMGLSWDTQILNPYFYMFLVADNLTITATPAETFANVTLQVNSQEFTSGNTYAVTGNVTVDATGTN